jgi:phosphodiesterase/alkaline phosphatase D-like protein
MISWTTNETSDSQVEYGTTTGYGSSTSLASALVTSHSAALSGLQVSTLYHYRVKSRDGASNLATSADFTFTTPATADKTAPVISSVKASSISAVGAIISWATNEASDSQVEYGTSTAYKSSTPLISAMVTSHSASLSGLQARKLYHYRIKSRDAAGNLATSADFTFTTAAARDTTSPIISAVGASSITASGATINWTTNEASDTQVEYGSTSAYESSTSLNASRVTTHNQVLSGLAAGKLHHYRIKSRDAAGNLAVSGDFKFNTAGIDATKTLISRVGASWITAAGAMINWTSNEPSDGQVEFGINTTYGGSTTRVSPLAMSHGAKLSGLKASTRYHYRIKSRDAAGNLVTSGDYAFVTAAPDNTPPVISSVAV